MLEIRGLSKTFPGTRALAGIDFGVADGEIHAVIGQNGSGKSTLVKVLAGYHQPDRFDTASLAGRPFALGSARAAASAGLRFVHQDLGLIGSLSAAENLELISGHGPWLRRVQWRKTRASARQAMRALGYEINVSMPVSQLAAAERMAVAVARALADQDAGEVRLLVLDEPTAALPGPEVDRLFTAMRAVKSRGVAVLFVSHHLNEVLAIADRVTVLRDGRRVTTCATDGATQHELADLMLGRRLATDLARHSPPPAVPGRPPILEVKGLAGQLIRRLDLDVHSGEVVGITGLTGSGAEEAADLISGDAPRAGVVRVAGRELPGRDARAAIEAGIAFVPADRSVMALIPGWTVATNITLPGLEVLRRHRLLNHRAERREAEEWLERLDIIPRRPASPISELSGGNQQKVVLARWLRQRARVLVLEEPTQGVDVGAKADIHELVDLAARDGAAVVVCSSDADELARLCTSVVVLARGRVLEELRGEAVTPDRIDRVQLASPV
jgi:ribose transport system ATP-binding protein